MATVTFTNGKTVNFQGTPTQQDIDEVASQFGQAQPDSRDLLTKAGDFVEDNGLPGSKVGQSIGTLGGYLYNELMDHMTGSKNAQDYDLSAPTPLATAADAANSLLTVGIPGAGEEAAVAKTAPSILERLGSAPMDAIRSLAPESGVRQGALLGTASGAAQSLAAGNTDGGQVTRDAVTGGLYGGALGLGGRDLSHLGDIQQAQAGVTPQIATILRTATPEELAQNIHAAVAHTSDVTQANPYGLSQDMLEQAGTALKSKLREAQKAIGDVVRTSGDTPISLAFPSQEGGHAEDVLSNFASRVQDRFGHQIVDDFPAGKGPVPFAPSGDAMGDDLANYMRQHGHEVEDAGEPSLAPVDGSNRKISPADQNRILATYQDLKALTRNATLRGANDTIANLDDKVEYGKADQFGVDKDPVNALLAQTRHDISAAAKTSSPVYANANASAAALHKLDDFLGASAGKDLNSGQLLMRRVFYGDQSKNSIDLLNQIKDVTGVDLVKQAGLAKYAIENFGDDSQKTGLRQAIGGGARDITALSGYPSQVLRFVGRHLTAPITPDPAAYATSLTKGRSYALGKAGEALDDLLTGPHGDKMTGPIAQGLKEMGVPSEVVKTAAQKFLKTYLYNRLSAPQQ